MSDELVKKVDTTITQPKKFGTSSIHNRVAQAPDTTAESLNPTLAPDPSIMPNRVGLMLDASGSMGDYVNYSNDTKTKMDLLKEAINGFLDATDFNTTACAVRFFPLGDFDSAVAVGRVHMTTISHMIRATVNMALPSGGTPLASAMEAMLREEPLTNGIIVSDGEADNHDTATQWANRFREAEVRVDTVHIGTSTRGEELLKNIASITGGTFIKFSDVASFARSFKYLSPAYAGLLAGATAKEKRQLLNADEVK